MLTSREYLWEVATAIGGRALGGKRWVKVDSVWGGLREVRGEYPVDTVAGP